MTVYFLSARLEPRDCQLNTQRNLPAKTASRWGLQFWAAKVLLYEISLNVLSYILMLPNIPGVLCCWLKLCLRLCSPSNFFFLTNSKQLQTTLLLCLKHQSSQDISFQAVKWLKLAIFLLLGPAEWADVHFNNSRFWYSLRSDPLSISIIQRLHDTRAGQLI